MKLTSNKIFSFMLAAAFALTLAGCGGNGGGTAAVDPDPPVVTPEPTPQEMCAAEDGRFEDDGSCTSAADLEKERIAAEEAAADKVADATKSAGTKEDAIETEAAKAADATDSDLGGATDTDLAIAHKDGAVSISVSRGEDDDKVDFVKNEMADLTGADDSTGSMNVLGPNDDDETEIAIVYTDIQAPTDIPFVMADGKGRYGLNTNNNDAGAAQSLTINTSNVGNAASSEFPSTPDTTREYGQDVADTEDENEGAFEGTFDGASGTFECASNNCSLETNADGKVTTVSGTWRFTPGEDETVSETDQDYLHYGVWLKKTAQDDGSDEYNQVETFADSNLDASTTVAQVEGSASYKGGAAGVYVRNVYVPSTTGVQELDYANSGHFTAVVDLTATFGQMNAEDCTGANCGTIAPNLINTVSGTIDGFTLSGGEDASGWGVDVAGTVADNGISGTAKGGGGDDGSISGNFHGDETDKAPKVLVGEFNAEFTNGSVAGGFGARRQ